MENFEEFEIQFVGLKTGRHHFDYHITDAFFKLFDYDEFNAVDVDVDLVLEKKASLLELGFDISGSVNVNCDVSNEPYDQPVEGHYDLVVKFDHQYSDEDEEVLILPVDANKIEVQQYIYETIILAVPLKKVHPKVADGSMQSDILDKLKELTPGHSEEKKNDPRWDKLKKLLNENKN